MNIFRVMHIEAIKFFKRCARNDAMRGSETKAKTFVRCDIVDPRHASLSILVFGVDPEYLPPCAVTRKCAKQYVVPQSENGLNNCLSDLAARTFIAVDLPSGLDADTGEPHGAVVAAQVTATMVAPKLGLETAKGRALAGDVRVVDIGVPTELIERVRRL